MSLKQKLGEPREWWIGSPTGASTRQDGYTSYECYDVKMKEPKSIHHVVDKHAYDKLLAVIEVYQEALEFSNMHLESMNNYSIISGTRHCIQQALDKAEKLMGK